MDREQFEQQIGQHTPALVDYARRAAGDFAEDAVNTAVADLLDSRAWEHCASGSLWKFLKSTVHNRLRREFRRRQNERVRLYDGTPIPDGGNDGDWDDEAQEGLTGFYSSHKHGDGTRQPEFIVADPTLQDDGSREHTRVPNTVPRASWPSHYAKTLHELHAVRLDLMQAFETVGVPPGARLAIWPFERPVKHAPSTQCKCGAPRYAETDNDDTVEVTALVCTNGHRELTVDDTADRIQEDWRWRCELGQWRWRLDSHFRFNPDYPHRRARRYRDILADSDDAFIHKAARQRTRRLPPAFERAASLTLRSPGKRATRRPVTPRSA
jgi:hypothetical protein